MKPDSTDQAITALEGNIDKLQALYNQYFMGIEKLQPSVVHKSVERTIQQLRKQPIQNTAQRFRLQSLLQRFNTLNNHWRRICREIEEGTYKRHIDRVKRRQEHKSRPEAPDNSLPDADRKNQDPDLAYDLSSEFDDLFKGSTQGAFESAGFGPLDLDEPFKQDAVDVGSPEEKGGIGALDDPFGEGIWPESPGPKTPPLQATPTTGVSQKLQPVPPKPTPSPRHRSELNNERSKAKPETPPQRPQPQTTPIQQPTAKPDAIDARRAHAIFRTFVAARAKCNERTDNISLDKLSTSLNKQYQSKGGEVDFKVVIKNGKAAIKAVPKKKD